MEDGKVMNKLDVLYEDNHIIVVNKPCNILSQSDCTGDLDMLTMVKEYVKEKYHKPGNVYIGLVHRLDRPVSGIMVFARTSKAASRLSEQIRLGKIHKTYIAVIHSILEEDRGIFQDYLKRDAEGYSYVTSKEQGKYAELHYKVLGRNSLKNETLVEIDLKTGRHHQIRVQFSSRGYPLCGDQRYGKIDYTQIALCSYKLSFIHPVSKKKLFFQIDIPSGTYWDDFK